MILCSKIRDCAAATLAVLLLAACSQAGDFGRSNVDPTSSYRTAQASGDDAVMPFALTDEEREMSARIFRFLNMDHTVPWLNAIKLSTTSYRPDKSEYFVWLRAQNFASSRGRYNKLENDARLDLVSLPQTFAAICQVLEIDRRRQVATDNLVSAGPETIAASNARRLENSTRINQFVAGLSFRYDAYVYALEHLLVETPHEQARDVDETLSELATASQFARSNRFCDRPVGAMSGSGEQLASLLS